MLVLGVTGDVGAGKSTVTRIFAESGATIINADNIAHEIWKNGDVLAKAAGRWGEEVLLPDGRINPIRVASIVFSDRTEYGWLCQMLHPLIRSDMERRISVLEGFVVAEIPLLFENGVPWWIDITMYISAPYMDRQKRNLSRGWEEDEILRRESFLMDRDKKISMADILVRNEGSLDSLKNKIFTLTSQMKDFATLAEISLSLNSHKDAVNLSESVLSKGLALNVEVYPVSTFSVSDKHLKENKSWKLSIITFQKNFNQILMLSEVSGVTIEASPSLKAIKRPGNIWKQNIPEEVRA